MKKRKLIILLASVIVIIGVALGMVINMSSKTPPEVLSLSQDCGLSTEGVNLIAHRGFSAVAPENSAPAFVESGKAGFFATECDIQLTKDNVWVVNHDSDIKRMTDGKGKISELTYDEILKCSVDGGYFVEKYDALKLITLQNYLAICDEYKIIPQIEIKSGNNRCLEEILSALDEYEGMREKAIIISFDAETLKSLRALDNDIEIWYLVHEITSDAISFCKENNFALAFNGNRYIDKEFNTIPDAQKAGLTLACWTIDNPEIYEQLYAMGIRNFTTNRLVK